MLFYSDQRNRKSIEVAERGNSKEAVVLITPLFGVHNAKLLVRVLRAKWPVEIRAAYQFRLRWFGDTETLVHDADWQQQLWGDHEGAHVELTSWLHSFELRQEQRWTERNALLAYQAVRERMRSPELTQWFLALSREWLSEAERTGAAPMHPPLRAGSHPFHVTRVLDALTLETSNRLMERNSWPTRNLAHTREARWARFSAKTAQNVVTEYLVRAGLKRTVPDNRVRFVLK